MIATEKASNYLSLLCKKDLRSGLGTRALQGMSLRRCSRAPDTYLLHGDDCAANIGGGLESIPY